LIGCMFAHAKTHDMGAVQKEIVGLNTSSRYNSMLERVFKEWTPLLAIPGYEERMEEGVLNVKYGLSDKGEKEVKKEYYPWAPARQAEQGDDPLELLREEVARARHEQARRPQPAPMRAAQAAAAQRLGLGDVARAVGAEIRWEQMPQIEPMQWEPAGAGIIFDDVANGRDE
jgi:hypothetical protein